jgi:hypothetical protein
VETPLPFFWLCGLVLVATRLHIFCGISGCCVSGLGSLQKVGDFTNKTWMVTAAEVTEGVLFFCKLNLNGTGAIAALANGCADSNPGHENFYAE